MEHIYNKLVEGLRDFFAQSGYSKAVIALSGGIDSAVVVALAVKALGKENVRVLLLPSGFSSSHSVDDSVDMAQRAGIQYDTISIEPIFEQCLSALAPVFEGQNTNLARENMQSRIRMVLTMATSNCTKSLMLNTSNRSEILVGYGTLYGDTGGAIGVIADLYKTEVYELAHYINEVQNHIIPQNIIDKEPSAELRDNQKDSDSLPEYPILDSILADLVDNHRAPCDIDFPSQIVSRVEQLVRCSAFKRSQLPPALKCK